MTNIKLLIIEDDMEFGQALAQALMLHNKEYSVTWKQSDWLLHYEGILLSEFDLLLIGTEVQAKEMEAIQSFQERGRLICREEFRRVSCLSDEIRLLYTKSFRKKNQVPDFSGKTRIIAFSSGGGGMGQSAAALTFSRILARDKELRTLYLSFEEFDSTDFYVVNATKSQGLHDFLYYLFSKEEEAIGTYLDLFLVCDRCGVLLFPSYEGRNPLRTLTEAELGVFFRAVLRYGTFQRIVLDLPISLDDSTVFLIKSCTDLIVVEDERMSSVYKNQQFCTYIEKELGMREKISMLHLDWEKGNFIGSETGMEIDIHHQLGREVRELAEQLEA